MEISNTLEGARQELLQHLEQFPYAHFRLVPLPHAQTKAKDTESQKPVPRPSALGKYAFVAGGSEEFAKEKQAEIEREDRALITRK